MGIPRKWGEESRNLFLILRRLAQMTGPVFHLPSSQPAQVSSHPTRPNWGQEGRGPASGQRTVSLQCLSEASRALPPPQHTTGKHLPGSLSPMLLNTAENSMLQTLTTEADRRDGWTQQAASFTHTVPHICVGEGPQNQPSGFEVSALPGLQAKAPQNKSPSQAAKGLTHLP